MAEIVLQEIAHSYHERPLATDDWALKRIDLVWRDGGAYALLGPSGCGKTTLLNIISGLLKPSQGKVLFDGKDVTQLPPTARDIAQVFQFPVVYDTMTVFDNLAFPLRNRGINSQLISQRVQQIAEMLDLTESLQRRAAGLSADGKQKISLGRGLVRSHVNSIMFDEPLTVIDPHLKWVLRSKLKELHQEIGTTMIYVTHDQTEALTFADTVVVMHQGQVIQTGTPVELFERPAHTFVGHFIGSPGMNVLPCTFGNGVVRFAQHPLETSNKHAPNIKVEMLELGIRPEFVRLDPQGFPVELVKVDDVGRHRVLEFRHAAGPIKMIAEEDIPIPSDAPKISFTPEHTHLYGDGWRVE